MIILQILFNKFLYYIKYLWPLLLALTYFAIMKTLTKSPFIGTSLYWFVCIMTGVYFYICSKHLALCFNHEPFNKKKFYYDIFKGFVVSSLYYFLSFTGCLALFCLIDLYYPLITPVYAMEAEPSDVDIARCQAKARGLRFREPYVYDALVKSYDVNTGIWGFTGQIEKRIEPWQTDNPPFETEEERQLTFTPRRLRSGSVDSDVSDISLPDGTKRTPTSEWYINNRGGRTIYPVSRWSNEDLFFKYWQTSDKITKKLNESQENYKKFNRFLFENDVKFAVDRVTGASEVCVNTSLDRITQERLSGEAMRKDLAISTSLAWIKLRVHQNIEVLTELRLRGDIFKDSLTLEKQIDKSADINMKYDVLTKYNV